MAEVNIADVREYLTTAYSDEDITTLCSDYFRSVYDDFATGMTKGQKIQLLLDYCQRRGLIRNLLAALAKDRPEQYRQQFGAVAVERAPAVAPRERDPRQVFVSHARQDAAFAHRLADDLRRNGWRVWIAPDSIQPGEKWAAAVNRALEECGVLVLVLTPAALRSEWVATETSSAIMLQHQRKMRFIPLEVAQCDVPPLWDVYQRIPFRARYEDGLAALLALLGTGQAPRVPPQRALAAQPTTRPRWLWPAVGGVAGLLAVAVVYIFLQTVSHGGTPTPSPARTSSVPAATLAATKAPERTATTVAPMATAAATSPAQKPRLIADSTVYLRGGPGSNYPVVGQMMPGKEVEIIGRNASGDWWRIAWDGAGQAWVAGLVVKVLGPIDTLAVAEDIPLPTSTPEPPRFTATIAPPTLTRPLVPLDLVPVPATSREQEAIVDSLRNSAHLDASPPVVCTTCHDAGAASSPFQLRVVGTPMGLAFEVTKDVGLSAVCYECHNGRRAAEDFVAGKTTSYPHYSTAAELLSDTGGVTYGATVPNSPHGMMIGAAPIPNPAYTATNTSVPQFMYTPPGVVKGNIPGPCVVCHMVGGIGDAKDPNYMKVGEHSFNTVSPDGKFDYDASCKACHGNVKDFNMKSKADYDGNGKVEGVQDEVKGLLSVLWRALEAEGVKKIDTGDPYATIPTNAEAKVKSAWFNFRFAYGVMWGTGSPGNEGKAAAIHNFKRTVALLQLSIKDLTGSLPAGATEMK